MALRDVIASRALTYAVLEAGAEVLVDGVLQAGEPEEVDHDLAIFPVTAQDLKAMPEGYYTTEDLKVYEVGGRAIPMKSVLTYGGAEYVFMAASDRDRDGGFTWYLAKKRDDNASTT